MVIQIFTTKNSFLVIELPIVATNEKAHGGGDKKEISFEVKDDIIARDIDVTSFEKIIPRLSTASYGETAIDDDEVFEEYITNKYLDISVSVIIDDLIRQNSLNTDVIVAAKDSYQHSAFTTNSTIRLDAFNDIDHHGNKQSLPKLHLAPEMDDKLPPPPTYAPPPTPSPTDTTGSPIPPKPSTKVKPASSDIDREITDRYSQDSINETIPSSKDVKEIGISQTVQGKR